MDVALALYVSAILHHIYEYLLSSFVILYIYICMCIHEMVLLVVLHHSSASLHYCLCFVMAMVTAKSTK